MWRALFCKRKVEGELDEEIQQYITEATKDKIASGMTPEEARRAALVEFGGVEQVKEAVRQSRSGMWIDTLLRDVQYTFRIFRRNPSFAIIAILTSALGIGAATATFSVVDKVLLWPLPYKELNRLVEIWATIPALRNDPAAGPFWDHVDPPYTGYQEFRARQRAFDVVGAFSLEPASMLQPGEPRHINLGKAEARLFRMLALSALHGRLILENDERADAPFIAVLGYEMWMKNFGGDPNVLGRRVIIETSRFGGRARTEYTIMGVLSQNFELPGHNGAMRTVADLWVPIGFQGGVADGQSVEILGLLRPAISIADAEKETATIFSELPFDPSVPSKFQIKFGAQLIYWREQETAPARRPLFLIFAASGLLLLIACGNVANLLLDRAVGRQHEMGLRAALGASHSRIMAQLVIESVVLSATGGMIGSLVATWLIHGLVRLAPERLPYVAAVGIDLRVLSFAVLCSIVTGISFGLLPALAGARVQLNSGLKNTATNRGSHPNRIQRSLIVAEISISFVLLIAAALMVRSLVRLTAVNPGLRPDRLLTLNLTLPPSRYGDPARTESFYRDLLPRLRSLPGVKAVTGRQGTPFTDYHSVGVSKDVVPEGAPPEKLPPAIESRAVLPNYFDVVGTPVTEGRTFTEMDVAHDPVSVFIVNKALARAFWPTHSALNQRLGGGRVVGVVDDPKEFNLRDDAQPMYYIPNGANRNNLTLLLRTAVDDPTQLASAVRHEIRAIDPALPIDRMETMDNLIAASHAGERYRMVLIVAFAAAAVVLVLIGLYGVISRSVGQRTRELGIRIALGARPREVLWLVLRHSLGLALAGIAIGCAAALAATRLVTSFLFGITATDISTYAAIAAGLIAISLVASYIPARRAARIDPAESLRAE